VEKPNGGINGGNQLDDEYLTCKIGTLEQIDTQFVRIDYVEERNISSKFGLKKSVHGGGGLQNKQVNLSCDFIIFLWTNVENRPLDGFRRLMAQKTRNRARICLLR